MDIQENYLMALLLIGVFFILEIIYLGIAKYLKIKDRPNARSSHRQSTIRGGGIIFPVAWLVFFIMSDFQFMYVTLGLMLVAVISFVDDITGVSSVLRLIFHTVAFSLCFYEWHLFSLLPWYALLAMYIVCIGCINAINFMDGINGITGLNALSILVPLFLLDKENYFSEPIIFVILSIVVFLFFNLRKTAICFAGDVGSVSLGYILIFLIVGLLFGLWKPSTGVSNFRINEAHTIEYKYILLLAVFGVDSVLTIAQRLIQKENIFQPHRKHLYQLLANELKIPHIIISVLYASLQLFITNKVLNIYMTNSEVVIAILIMSAAYIGIKMLILKYINGKTVNEQN